MDEHEAVGEGPPIEEFSQFFRVVEIERGDGDRLVYYGEPRARKRILERHVWPLFREHGFEVRLTTRSETDPITGVELADSRVALVAEPRSVGIESVPWTNVVLALLTVVSTLLAGARWYSIDVLSDPLAALQAWPFAASVLVILGVHEFGHYLSSRYHGVAASLPYFIPIPNVIGTLGAVIRMRGRMPDRKSLFDIGVSGPLAGFFAAMVVTVLGLQLDPVVVPAGTGVPIQPHYPLAIELLADLTGGQLHYADPTRRVNPVVVAGWVGTFITFLNLLPVGQLDGGHVVRAVLGERQETVAALVPAVLFALAGYLYYVRGVGLTGIFLWLFWGVIALVLARVGSVTPIYDEALDRKRLFVAALVVVCGLLCVTLVPFEILTG